MSGFRTIAYDRNDISDLSIAGYTLATCQSEFVSMRDSNSNFTDHFEVMSWILVMGLVLGKVHRGYKPAFTDTFQSLIA
jgi:hypothetical protein